MRGPAPCLSNEEKIVKKIITAAVVVVVVSTAFLSGAFGGADAAVTHDVPLEVALGYVQMDMPVLKPGQLFKDERGCIYSVVKAGNRISLNPVANTYDGKIVCK